jgi:hypothetical protein
MGHFAKVVDGKVTQVIVAEPDFFNTFVDPELGQWIQTSYNTRGNIHYAPNTNEPDGGIALRGNYAGIGYTYDDVNDVFYPPKPFNSWVLSTETWNWMPPVAYPNDDKFYVWDEDTVSWKETTINT